MEEVEKKLLTDKLNEFLPSPMTEDEPTEILQQHKEEQTGQTKIIDVLGQKLEPICNYYRCHHKFSLHGLDSHSCRCKHPMNRTLGVFRKYP